MLTRLFFQNLILLLVIQGGLSLIPSPCQAKKGCCCLVEADHKWDWAGDPRVGCHIHGNKGKCVATNLCPKQSVAKLEAAREML